MNTINELLNDTDPFQENYSELEEFLFSKYSSVSVESLKTHIKGLEVASTDVDRSKKDTSHIKDCIKILNKLIEQKIQL